MQHKFVKKAAGDIEPFSRKKLTRFLRRIEVPDQEIDKILESDSLQSRDQVSTEDIAKYVTERLCSTTNSSMYCARYNLKRDIRKMGPAGHTFEKYVGRLFQADGCEVQVGVEIEGHCVKHEIDVLARKEKSMHIVEAKFHNREGTKSDVTVALYVYARFLDVTEKFAETGVSQHLWIATNTKLTKTAYRYAACRGIHVLSIEQPFNNSIMDKVMREGLFPISTISELDPYLDKLFAAEFILATDILHLRDNQAKDLGIPIEVVQQAQSQVERILEETRQSNSSQKIHTSLI